MTPIDFLFVALGGALGAVARSLVYLYFAKAANTALFPLPTLAVNVLGSLVMGMVYVLIIEKLQLPPLWRQAVMVGFLGAFTTFSTFSLDLLRQIQQGAWLSALFYGAFSVILCLLAVWAGYVIMQRLL